MKNLPYQNKFTPPPFWVKRICFFSRYLYFLLFRRYTLNDRNSSLSCSPVFLIGSEGSGVDLLRSVLASNDQIFIPPDSEILLDLVVKFPHYFGGDRSTMIRSIINEFENSPNFKHWEISIEEIQCKLDNLSDNELSLAKIIDVIYQLYSKEKYPKAKLWGGQSPKFVYTLSCINNLFPNAKYIHLVRDGRDSISSLKTFYGSEIIREAVLGLKKSIRKIERFRKKIDPDRFLEVRYEDLVRNPDDTLVRICNYLGIKYSKNMKDFWRLPLNKEYEYYFPYKYFSNPLSSSSIGTWEDNLSEVQIYYVIGKIYPELIRFGYIPNGKG